MKTEEQKIKELKVGEIYNVRMRVLGINPKNREISTETVNELGSSLDIEPTYFTQWEAEAFSPIIPEPAPKYDSCRKFRKGDRVRVVENNGRTPTISSVIENLYEKTFTVIASEDSDNDVLVSTPKGNRFIPFYFLKLITPVEELEPYSVGGSIDGCILYKNGDYYAEFVNSCEAEKACKLLNAEHRKEQK